MPKAQEKIQGNSKEKFLYDITDFANREFTKAFHEQVKQFIPLFFENVIAEDFEYYDAPTYARIARNLILQGQNKGPGESRVRVYTPKAQDSGWDSPHTILEIVSDDMPFLVDSVTNIVNDAGVRVQLVIHPIVSVVRQQDNTISQILSHRKGDLSAQRESYMFFELSQKLSLQQEQDLAHKIEQVLTCVHRAVRDWKSMLAKVSETEQELGQFSKFVDWEGLKHISEFLTWARDDHFTFLGYRAYECTEKTCGVTESLGILTDPDLRIYGPDFREETFASHVKTVANSQDILLITKTKIRSLVHRLVPMDVIRVSQCDGTGKIVGVREFVGLFTSVAYNQSPSQMPLLREKVQAVMVASDLPQKSHDGKALMHILDTFPRDELFQMTPQELLEVSLGALYLQRRQKISLFARPAPFGHFVSCLVYIPRDRYDASLRERVKGILENAYHATCTSHEIWLGSSDFMFARVNYILATVPGQKPRNAVQTLEKMITEASLTWKDLFQQAVSQKMGDTGDSDMAVRYGNAFSVSYQDRYSPVQAIHDLEYLEGCLASGLPDLCLFSLENAQENHFGLKVYHPSAPLALSDILPVLEDMGLRLVNETTFTARVGGNETVWIYDFEVVPLKPLKDSLGVLQPNLRACFQNIWLGMVESDPYNALILDARFTWNDIVVFRSISRYLRQLKAPFEHQYMAEIVVKNADIALDILQLFKDKFHTNLSSRPDPQVLCHAVELKLERVSSLDEERVLRSFLNVVDAMLRTNFYQKDLNGNDKPYCSFKVDSGAILNMPLPRPKYEIFVYSARFEGVHLRGGKVARGGIRWSDRREDFRTEILGLMKAQMVKNAVIVPEGAKGGFVLKQLSIGANRDETQAEGIACYRLFISALLDVTDNLVDGQVVPPRDVVRYDGDDPYLVVAADKGTATFSDIANGISKDYGHWLGDAFASGGSVGYDHKKIGITARGAWESVKRHFLSLDIDTQNQDFTVVGVGDMSGDVFGNGMLRSPHICLVAAFNHAHIFIDPNPNPGKAFVERQRLFDLPRSSWTDYDATLISKGGGIFERNAKSIAITPEMKARFGITVDALAPNDLIQMLLTSSVDLLFFGGIGTYIKSSLENNVDVGDRANDGVRVDGKDLRCRVVGEGANLGCTQRGRVEYAWKGGLLNTDAIDNAGGVNCSDNEVNIKILLDILIHEGTLDPQDRPALLATMTNQVADLVLTSNYRQALILTLMGAQAPRLLDDQARIIRRLEKTGRLNRAVEFLPTGEVLDERAKAKRGLTMPEMSVLMAYSKLWLHQGIVDSDIPDSPVLQDTLVEYFPKELHAYGALMEKHPLRRDIIAMVVANDMVNRCGISFASEKMEKTGASLDDVVRAYLIVKEIFDLDKIWASVEAVETHIPAKIRQDITWAIISFVERTTRWFLNNQPRPMHMSQIVPQYQGTLETYRRVLRSVLPESRCQQLTSDIVELASHGVPQDLAETVASLDMIAGGCLVVSLTDQCQASLEHIARLFFWLEDRFTIDQLRTRGARFEAGSTWEKQAKAGMLEYLLVKQGEIVHAILQGAQPGESLESLLERWQECNQVVIGNLDASLEELKPLAVLDVSMLAVIARQLRILARA